MELKIKVCGMREATNLVDLVGAKPDFIGFIFYPKSQRYAGDKLDGTIIKHIPTSIKTVGVFVNEDLENLKSIQQQYNFNYLQLHGDESVEYCIHLKKNKYKIIKAFSVDASFDFDLLEAYQSVCDYFLFDTKGENYGGNGIHFDWNILNNYNLSIPFFLSGGISINDVQNIKKIQHPKLYAIDVNSKFEIKPGLKNIEKVEALIEALRPAEKVSN